MAIVIKKISKKALFSLVLAGGFFLALLVKIFFGSGHLNLSKLDLNARSLLDDGKAPLGVNSARADVPVPGDSGAGDSCASAGGSGGDSGGDSSSE